MTNKDHLKTAAVCLLLALGTALLYAPALRFAFVKYDDQLYVINNPHVNQGFRWAELGWCFQAGYASNWHPLTWISHMLDCQFYGLKAGGHHATNVLLHILNSVLLFLALRTMTGAFWRSAAVAALFAWHPLNVESVAWVAERKDLLATLFWILTLWAYVCYARRSQPASDPPGQESGNGHSSGAVALYSLALVSFALGLMAKWTVVTLPLVLLLLDWWPLGRLNVDASATSGGGAVGKRVLALLIEKTPFFVLGIISCVLTFIAQHRGGIIAMATSMPMRGRIINALAAIVRYLEKTVWPSDLGAILPIIAGWPMWKVAVTLVVLAVVTAMAFRWRAARPYWLVGWLWFLVALAPLLGIFSVGAQPMADHCTYLPSIGLLLIAAWDVYDIAGRWRYHQWIMGTTAAIVLGACLAASHYQLGFWQDSETLFSRVARANINAFGHAEYAAILMNRNQLSQAQTEGELAARIAPGRAEMRALLGRILFLEGKLQPAVTELRKSLELEPNLAEARLMLGQTLLAGKSPDAAAAEFATVVQAQPKNPEARFRLGQALMMMGKLDDASAQFNEVLRLAPAFPEAHFSLGLLSGQRHDPAGAIAHYEAALHLHADYPEALNNLAWLKATAAIQYRDGAKAVQLAQRACQLTRNTEPAMVGTLAAAYAQAGRFDEAVATAQKAHDMAAARGEKSVAERNLRFIDLYRAHKTVSPNDQ